MVSARILLLSFPLLASTASADIVWTGAVSSDIFDEANWDLTNSTVTSIEPSIAIMDDVVIANAAAPVRLLSQGAAYAEFRVAEGHTMTIDNSFVRAFGDEGFGSDPGTSSGIDILVINGGTLRTYFVTNRVRVDVDASSTLIFDDPDNPVNGSSIDISIGSELSFSRETPMEFTNEHLSKLTVDSAPAVIGTNISVVSDGAAGSIISALQQPVGVISCLGELNSVMLRAELTGFGSTAAAANDVFLQCSQMPAFVFGFLVVSRSPGFVSNPAGSDGNLCLSGAIGRYVGPGQIQNSGVMGQFGLQLDLTMTPQPNGFESVVAGDTWYFQCWYRDAGLSGMGTSNFSSGLMITFN